MGSRDDYDFGNLSLRAETVTSPAASPSPDPPCTGTSEESPVYATPASRSVSQADRDSGEASVSKVGLVVVHSPDEFCLGAIKGEPKRWCTRSRAECKTQWHPFSRLNVEANTYYIRCPRAGQARYEPSLSIMCQFITSEDDATIVYDLKPLDVWVTYLRTVLELEGRALREQRARLTTA